MIQPVIAWHDRELTITAGLSWLTIAHADKPLLRANTPGGLLELERVVSNCCYVQTQGKRYQEEVAGVEFSCNLRRHSLVHSGRPYDISAATLVDADRWLCQVTSQSPRFADDLRTISLVAAGTDLLLNLRDPVEGELVFPLNPITRGTLCSVLLEAAERPPVRDNTVLCEMAVSGSVLSLKQAAAGVFALRTTTSPVRSFACTVGRAGLARLAMRLHSA